MTDGDRVLDFGLSPSANIALPNDWSSKTPYRLQDAGLGGGAEPVEAFQTAEAVLNQLHVEAFEAVLQDWSGERPGLVGVHGQTVLHRRPSADTAGSTRQILDAEGLSASLGARVVYDFRSDDVASGGEGAPLAPIYHKALLERLGGEPAAALNLGGVANITFCGDDGSLVAFDTGPANGPVDEWVEAHGRGAYDEDGRLAAAGAPHQGLLAQILDHPYFDEPPPKSLDRFDFDANLARGLSLEDGAATLTALSACGVARAFEHAPQPPSRVIVCGGGRRNPSLMAALREFVPCDVLRAEDVGWRGDSIEAEAFALLAVRRLRGLPISWPSTTGAPHPMTGGRIADP